MDPLWPDWIEDMLWAKNAEEGQNSQGESLARHTWYVLSKLSDTIRLRPDLPENINSPHLWNTLFWACFLHDFGKAAQGFQDRLRGGVKWPHRHEVLSLAFIDWIAAALSEDERKWVIAAIVSHHKDADEIRKLYFDPVNPDEDTLIALVAGISPEALTGLYRWLAESPHSWIESLGLSNLGIRIPALAPPFDAVEDIQRQGALRIRNSLRTYRLWLKNLDRSRERSLAIGTLALRGYVTGVDHIASAHATQSPVSLVSFPDKLLERLGIAKDRLYTHQKICASTRGSAILISPTGSGKTESALLWSCAQANNELPVPRLFYTLPYQASMNAMYNRLNGKAFPDQVGLEHSRSVLALYRHWLSEDYSPQQASRAAKWSKNLARLNYFPVRVLSPYQILKAPYRLKGYESLLSDCFDAAFIFDEIHAYEIERLAMILATMKYLRENFRARFFVMSATLPRLLRTKLSSALGESAFIQASPELFAQFCRHELHLIDDDLLTDHWLASIIETAGTGQSILVCCNTVKRAMEVFTDIQVLVKGSINVILLHGRFNGKDRLEKENLVQKYTGSQSSERRPIILVATQVIEVSLDIDLDVIYSDPAPLEALIQRFGRINRCQRKKYARVHVFTKPSDGQGIYSEDLIQEALKVLSKNDSRMINEEYISDWLDEVYTGPIAAKWDRTYNESYSKFEGACLSSLRAFNSDSTLEQEFYRAFDSIEVLPACFESAYEKLMERGEPLEASQLLVPLRWSRYCKLRRDGQVKDTRPDLPRIVDVKYSDKGLEV